MEHEIGILGPQGRPLLLGLLDAIFPEDPLPRFEERAHLIGPEGLGHGHEFHALGRRTETPARLFHAGADIAECLLRGGDALGHLEAPFLLTLEGISGDGPGSQIPSKTQAALPLWARLASLLQGRRQLSGERYNPRESEPKWQKVWDERKSFVTSNDDTREPYYVLEMFPYPSGRIHMGHVRNYSMGDVVARYHRARGRNVLHPMGWDAFGLPAENAAIERKTHPGTWTYQNIEAMKAQLKSMGLAIDWTREIATCSPDYYQHQQAMFIDMLEAGLVTRKSSKVNWDPVDMTVLANEQVIDGRGWRSGAVVEQRELTQWFFKISDFAEDLLTALDGLTDWPEKVRTMQRNWIGKSEGLRLLFELVPSSLTASTSVEVFTTRPDTIFGASFVGLSPDHPLTTELAAANPALPSSWPSAIATAPPPRRSKRPKSRASTRVCASNIR